MESLMVDPRVEKKVVTSNVLMVEKKDEMKADSMVVYWVISMVDPRVEKKVGL